MSDDCDATDKLIKACEKVVSSAPVVERTLVPYFDSASETLAITEVQRKLLLNSSSNSGRKNTRSGSPTSSVHNMVKGSRPVKVAKGSAPVKPDAIVLSATPDRLAVSPLRSPSAAFAVPMATPVRVASAAATAAAIMAACPAIYKSPKPSDLPMPSSALLRRISFTDVPAAMNVMMPMALPIMVAA